MFWLKADDSKFCIIKTTNHSFSAKRLIFVLAKLIRAKVVQLVLMITRFLLSFRLKNHTSWHLVPKKPDTLRTLYLCTFCKSCDQNFACLLAYFSDKLNCCTYHHWCCCCCCCCIVVALCAHSLWLSWNHLKSANLAHSYNASFSLYLILPCYYCSAWYKIYNTILVN